MNAELMLWLLGIASILAWLVSGVSPIRLTIDLLELVERVFKTAWECCLDLPETFADRWANPARSRQAEATETREELSDGR